MKVQFRWDIFNVFNNKNFLFAGLDVIMDASAVTLNAARDHHRERDDSVQLRPGDPDA